MWDVVTLMKNNIMFEFVVQLSENKIGFLHVFSIIK